MIIFHVIRHDAMEYNARDKNYFIMRKASHTWALINQLLCMCVCICNAVRALHCNGVNVNASNNGLVFLLLFCSLFIVMLRSCWYMIMVYYSKCIMNAVDFWWKIIHTSMSKILSLGTLTFSLLFSQRVKWMYCVWNWSKFWNRLILFFMCFKYIWAQ